jgi:hypothetical protein
MSNDKQQTAVEWLMPKILELSLQLSLRRISQRNCELEMLKLFEQAKEMEEQKNIELITWVKENFTSEAPLDYIISEYKKLEVTNEIH